MATNDKILLDTNFEAWKAKAGDLKGISPWLYYCVEQFIKSYQWEPEEIHDGFTEGGNDGGADAIYFLVNQGHIVSEDIGLDASNVCKMRLMIFQTKTSGGFGHTQIDKWIELMDDFLDLCKSATSFGERYNDRVVRIMKTCRQRPDVNEL